MPDYYGSIAGFQTYHTARGRDVSNYGNTEINAALLVGSEWLDNRYRSSLGGVKIGGRVQLREFPRTGITDVNGFAVPGDTIPTEVENATYEIALRNLVAPGSLSVDWTPPKYKRVSVDGAVSVEYALFGDANDIQTRFKIVDEILSLLLHPCNSSLSGPSGRM